MTQTGVIRKPYTGQKKAIAIALDVGTTFSGVSYALLDPGQIPKIYEVTSFPGQEHQAGNPKIPSVIWYDRHGDPVKHGAEAEEQYNINAAEEHKWIKVELFKLRLRPKSMKLSMNGMSLPHLPESKSAVQVFGDFLKYLLHCTRSFIIETHATGASVWKTVENDIQFILSHPNGWEGAQQSKMRKAAIYGGLVPNTDEGKARVRFVTEGEASLHACVLNGLIDDVLSNPSQHGFVVVDAGGGTLDISSYAIKGASPLLIEEIAPPDCLFSGSVFVSRRARKFLEEKLNRSDHYSTPAMLDHITKRFDETTKRLFRTTAENQYLAFGSPLDTDHVFGIRNGRLKLTGDEIAKLFEPSIEDAVNSIRNQVILSGGMVKSVWLVGGFAPSPWLFAQLQERLGPDGLTVSRPDGQTSKAVANGAIGFYCDHHVGARVAKYMYGVEFLREFDPADPEHIERQTRLFQLPSGPRLLPDAFDCILARNSKVKESTTFSRKYCTELTSLSTLSVFEIEIWCYRGPGEQPKWILRGQDDFSTLCFVRADLSPLRAGAKAMTGHGGNTYWRVVFSIEIHFGLTEFKARIKWNDDGEVKYGPASIVYDESGNKELEDDRDSQDEISALPPSRYASRAPSMAPSRTHSASNTPQTLQSPDDDHSAVGTLIGAPMSRTHSTSQPHGDRNPDGHTEPSASKKPKSSGSHSHSHHRSSSHQLSPNPSTVSHRASRSERSQHSPSSSQHPSQHSTSPREPPRDAPHHSPSPRELSHPPASHPVSQESSQLGHQNSIFAPTSTVPTQHHDREISRNEHQTPNDYTSTPTQPQSQQLSTLPSVLNETTSSISRDRTKGVVTTVQPPEPPTINFPSVSTMGSPYDTPAPRSTRESRTTSLTPSDSASNVPINYLSGNGNVPVAISGAVTGSPLPESTPGRKSRKDKNRSFLSTITSASNFTAKPPIEQPQPPESAPLVPRITIPDSPSVSSSFGSRLTTNPNTPINTRSLKPSLLSNATNNPEQQPPPESTVISRQNSDSVIPGGLGGTLGGVLNGVWGAYKSASASPIAENPPHGPVTAAFESTLETIEDVEVPGGFGGEREMEAPVPPQGVVPEPIVIPPSPKFEGPEPTRGPITNIEVANPPASEPAPPHEPETETVPQTPIEPEQPVLSLAEKKKAKKQREKERKEKEAQEKKEREEREQIERDEREAQERKDREEKKRQEKAEREARKKEREERERVEREEREALEHKQREAQEQEERKRQEKAEREVRRRERQEQERQERERTEREAREQAEREAREQAEQAARVQAEREARRRAEREANERAERIERVEREAREAQEQAEREAKEQAKKKRADKEAERAKREAERVEEAIRVKAEKDAKRKEKEMKEQAERERAEQEAREKAAEEAKEKAEREAKKAEDEAKERADREAEENAKREERERAERAAERERLEREKDAKEKADREAKEREEEEKKLAASKNLSPWGSTAENIHNDRSRKTSGLSQKAPENGWRSSWGFGSGKDESHDLPPIITSSVPGGILSGADFFSNKYSPDGAAEEVELRTPVTKGKGASKTPSNLSGVATPSETVAMGKVDSYTHEDPDFRNRSARVSISSENERFTDAEQGPSPPQPTHPVLTPEAMPEAPSNSTSELLNTPRAAKEEVPTTPKPWLPPSLTPGKPQVSTPVPSTEPEKPLSLWERKRLKTGVPSNLLSGDATNPSGAWGDTGSGGSTETIAMPTIPRNEDRQSTFTDAARDQKRENQREHLVEGILDSSKQGRRKNDLVQPQIITKPPPKPTPAPTVASQQKSSGWGSWGSSFLTTVANAVTERSPSPEPEQLQPKIQNSPRGFTPNQTPPKSQPAGFGPPNKPAWGGSGGSGDNSWGSAKNGPTPTAQRTSAGPAWGPKPVGGFGPEATTWGSTTGPSFGSGIAKNLTVDTTQKPLESSPNTAGPENIPESAVDIKHVPAPGTFGRQEERQEEKAKNEAGETQNDAWGWEGGSKDKGSKDSRDPSPVEHNAPEQQAEEPEEPGKTEEIATPVEEDGSGKKKGKKGKASSVAQTPSAPNTPDLDNAGGGAVVGGKPKKSRRAKK